MFDHFVGLVLKWLNLNLVKLKAANSRSDSFDQVNVATKKVISEQNFDCHEGIS